MSLNDEYTQLMHCLLAVKPFISSLVMHFVDPLSSRFPVLPVYTSVESSLISPAFFSSPPMYIFSHVSCHCSQMAVCVILINLLSCQLDTR